jgi:hypothetical protein
VCSFLVSEWLVKSVSAVIDTNLVGAAVAVVMVSLRQLAIGGPAPTTFGRLRDLAAENFSAST